MVGLVYCLPHTFAGDPKFLLANVKDVNYRTEETPSESENVNNNHAYEYDANGNLVYVNTSRTKKDGIADEKAAERKLKWNEENRLLASDDNGFVTNYWYDADGERTVKTSGESDQVYVNSEFAGGRTNTAKFSLYVSPYLVANQGGRYTKHIYIDSQRVVSKIGDFDSYGSDPRRIQYAGSETDGLSVDYKTKYAQQLQVIKDNYATFEVPYNGEDNDDYVDGKGFCCNDGSIEAAQAKAMKAATTRAASGNFQESDAYEKLQFYYHPDHLGSSSYITDLDGEVVQHIEYVPFGEVFVEERNNIWNTPYLFNAKEFDEETGLYYYGVRYYDPRLGVWISVDPISNFDPRNAENYLDGQHNGGVYNSFNLFPYEYCYQNPVLLVDPTGKQANSSVLLARNPNGDYNFTPAAAHILHLVSKVNEYQIRVATVRFVEANIWNGSIGTEGSSLTAGKDPNNAVITHYYKIFKDGKTYLETNGSCFYHFLGRNAHEVGHIPQVNGYKHFTSSISEYLKNIAHGENWHDGSFSQKEKEADKGQKIFKDFNNFINSKIQKNGLKRLFYNKINSQDQIIEKIDQWWKMYNDSKSNKER